LVSNKHSPPRQPEPGALAAEAFFLDKRPKIVSVPGPRVHAVPLTNCVEIYAGRQSQAGEEDVPQALGRRQSRHFEGRWPPLVDAVDVFRGRRDILPPNAIPRRVRPAAEPEPVAVGPVLQVVA